MSQYNSLYKFQDLLSSSRRFTCKRNILFTYSLSNDKYLYLMVNKSYGNAPSRNVFKRRARFLFSQLIKKYPDKTIGIMIKPLRQNISYGLLKQSFSRLENQINLESSLF